MYASPPEHAVVGSAGEKNRRRFEKERELAVARKEQEVGMFVHAHREASVDDYIHVDDMLDCVPHKIPAFCFCVYVEQGATAGRL